MVTRICKKNDQLDAEICFPQHMEFNEKDAKLLATPFASVKHFASEEVASECGVQVPVRGGRDAAQSQSNHRAPFAFTILGHARNQHGAHNRIRQ